MKRSKSATEATTWTQTTADQKLAIKDAGIAPEDEVRVKIENSAWPAFAQSKVDLRKILNQLVGRKTPAAPSLPSSQ